MRYVEARINEYERQETYRIYISKSLQLIPQSRYLQASYQDLFKREKAYNKSSDEIVVDIFNRADLRFE